MTHIETTGNFTSEELLSHEIETRITDVNPSILSEIADAAVAHGLSVSAPVTIAIEFEGKEIFRKALPGASDEHAGWIIRKSRVVNLTHHSTMYERVRAEELEIDWHLLHGVVDETHAIHGGGFPILNREGDFKGVLIICGLPQVEDHLFALQVMREVCNANS